MELIYYAFAFYIGWRAREIYASKQLKKTLESIQEQIEVEESNTSIVILSKENGVIYAYDEKDNKFLTQGKNIDEIADNLSKLHPNKTFRVYQSDLNRLDDDESI